MDDLAYGIRYPSVIDLKIGMQTFDPEATSEQINRHKMKYPFVKNIGFQIEGMRVSQFPYFVFMVLFTLSNYNYFLEDVTHIRMSHVKATFWL